MSIRTILILATALLIVSSILWGHLSGPWEPYAFGALATSFLALAEAGYGERRP